MILDTRQLFLRLLRVLDVDVVCDVGSLNGADSLRFRHARPDATIFAFEANPANAQRMRTARVLERARIEVVPLAVCERDGEADFFVVDAKDAPLARQGMSSLFQRAAPAQRGVAVRVGCARLDAYLAPRLARDARIALWIDVEGAAFEALSGALEILDSVTLIHVEVETAPCIASGQRLWSDVHALLAANGFRALGVQRSQVPSQVDALYVRADRARRFALRVAAARGNAFLRHAVWRAFLAALPGRASEFLRRRKALPADVPLDA